MSARHALVPVFIATLLIAGIARPASAQPLSSDVALKPGQIYWVTRTDGMEVRGFITGRTASDLQISGETGPTTIAVSDVFRISKPDGLKEGFFLGAGIGAAWVALGNDSRFSTGQKVGVGATWALMTGGIGALIDKAIHGRTDVYRRTLSPSVSLRPIASRQRLGLRATVRW